MADFESALSELGAALAATDTKLSTSLAEILGVAIQEVIEAELTDPRCAPGRFPELLEPRGQIDKALWAASSPSSVSSAPFSSRSTTR